MRNVFLVAVMAALAMAALTLSPKSDLVVAGSAQALTANEMAQTSGGWTTEEACTLDVCDGTNGCNGAGNCYTYYPHNNCQYTGNPVDNCQYGSAAGSLCFELGQFEYEGCTGPLTGQEYSFDQAACDGTTTLRNPVCS